MLQVNWDRVEGMCGWALETLQWRLNERILLPRPWNWDPGMATAPVPGGGSRTMGTGGGLVATNGLLAHAGTRTQR